MGIYSQDWKSEEIKGEKGGDRDEDGGGVLNYSCAETSLPRRLKSEYL